MDACDTMEVCENMDVVPKGRSLSDIKSTAIVKYTSASIPLSTGFSQLQLNTNLNVPPSNWLRSSSGMERYIRDYTWRREHSEFSSIRMANNFPDLTGEVDVVSGSQNIKKLLKMPLCKSSHVSMMVHRIGKTLLLDEFDIHKLLLRNQEEEWTWLRHFFYDIVAKDMQGKMKCIPRRSKSRNTLEKRNMYSKFLYHSLVATCNQNELVWQTRPTSSPPPAETRTESLDLVPDPLPKSESEFDREILWKFEDIHMLIGTDLPIFGGTTHPCVSLRLRDSATPINVLTGLDYWLDNLMCNVPEVAMCFHLNGIVQKYELIKTEDIPNLDDCKFDPQLITDIARNILSFLKSNATKEGHTYWLYKDVDDDVVKLYDLTALCGEGKTDRCQNPFTVPVGILLYRVARNMRQSADRKSMATIRELLENSLLLLDEDKHSQVCTSAHYLLSDLYVPDCSVHDVWSISSSEMTTDDTEDSPMSDDDDSDVRTEISVGMNDLVNKSCLYNHMTKSVKSHPIAGTVEERCHDALKHIRKGLDCILKEKAESNTRKSSSIVEEQVPCNQSQAIPLHYQPLKTTHKGGYSLELMSHKAGLTLNKPWQCLSSSLLMRKSSMTFFALAKAHLSAQKYGNALKYIRFAVHCFEAMSSLIPQKAKENQELLSLVLEVAGDIRLVMGRISNGFEDHSRDYDKMSEDEAAILHTAQSVITVPELAWVYVWTLSMEQNLMDSSRCYERALHLIKDRKVEKEAKILLAKRYGNSLNELGVLYMNQAQVFLQSGTMLPLDKIEELWENSEKCFTKGIEAFCSVADQANQALLHSNRGRLMRLCARCYTHITMQKDRPEFSAKERQYYFKAIDCYQRALDVLGSSERLRPDQFHDIRESVKWDLSSTYFNMAMMLQDYAPLSTHPQEEIEKQVTDLMNKSLKYCTTDERQGRDLTLQQYRAATINHRLASLYHNSYRNQEINDQKRRHLRQLAEHHYDRAMRHFLSVEAFSDLLRVELERVAMLELFYQSQSSSKGKLRCLHSVFLILLSCRDAIVPLCSQADGGSEEKSEPSEESNLYFILLSRIQFVLLQLIKTYSTLQKRHCENTLKDLKRFYAQSLQSETEKVDCLKERWKWVADFLSELVSLRDQLAREAA
ncbi:erythroid differentiation-related factor 1-like [Gigantopelta aegis]|uniref:erythroid differentiation-related factor 1-like n=1 Tax=Gigantopelta aegis TaxID=1735272 RepID=UPI001B88A06B|nr:erythroid differentiation-related factor 1-like [Gigantopelta aegis]